MLFLLTLLDAFSGSGEAGNPVQNEGNKDLTYTVFKKQMLIGWKCLGLRQPIAKSVLLYLSGDQKHNSSCMIMLLCVCCV